MGQRHFGGTMIGNVALIHHFKILKCSNALNILLIKKFHN